MNHSDSGIATGTSGKGQLTCENGEARAKAAENEAAFSGNIPQFSSSGHVSSISISENRELFYGKTAEQINDMLKEKGYQTIIRNSKHKSSAARIIVCMNSDEHRNITQVQVSPGNSRHGNVPYVKISTCNAGKFKIVDALETDYVTDGLETATIFFRRIKQ